MEESIVLVFTDNTYACLGVTFYGSSYELELNDDPNNYLQQAAGAISTKEYYRLENEKITNRELAELSRLKSKYEAGN